MKDTPCSRSEARAWASSRRSRFTLSSWREDSERASRSCTGERTAQHGEGAGRAGGGRAVAVAGPQAGDGHEPSAYAVRQRKKACVRPAAEGPQERAQHPCFPRATYP